MNRLSNIILISLIGITLNAQVPKVKNGPVHDDEPVHFGYSIGLNWMDAYIEPYNQAEIIDLSPGFQVQIVSNFRLGNNLDLRILPGLSFGARRTNLSDGFGRNDSIPLNDNYIMSNIDSINKTLFKTESNYLEFPFLLKFKANRVNNFRPYIIGGANIRYDLTQVKENLFGSNDPEPETLNNDYPNKLIFKSALPYYEVGAGFDFYLVYFKLSLELRYSRSIFDGINRAKTNPFYTSPIEKYQPSVFQFSVHFEGY